MIQSAKPAQLCDLNKIELWPYQKILLKSWLNVLKIFDTILAVATNRTDENPVLCCDLPGNEDLLELTNAVIKFMSNLVVHSAARDILHSLHYFFDLTHSTDLNLVLHTMDILHYFFKRSSFYAKTPEEMIQKITTTVTFVATPFGGLRHNMPVENNTASFDATKISLNIFSRSISVSPDRSINFHFDLDKLNPDKKQPLSFIVAKLAKTYHLKRNELTELMHWLRWHFYFADKDQRIRLYTIQYHAITSLSYKKQALALNFFRETGNFISLLKAEKFFRTYRYAALQAAAIAAASRLMHGRAELRNIALQLELDKPHGIIPLMISELTKITLGNFS